MKQTLSLAAIALLALTLFLVLRSGARRSAIRSGDQGQVVMGPDGKFTLLPASNKNFSVTLDKSATNAVPAAPAAPSTQGGKG